jgi:catechol 2,3-dioxygenase
MRRSSCSILPEEKQMLSKEQDPRKLRIVALGHVVLRVSDLERSVTFYRDVLRMKEVARYGRTMVFFSLGSKHHDLALMEIGKQARPARPDQTGLYHVAFKVGDDLDTLAQWKKHLRELDVPVLGESDHRVSQALYIQDPDGIEIELYVDSDPSIWKDDPSAVATIRRIEW